MNARQVPLIRANHERQCAAAHKAASVALILAMDDIEFVRHMLSLAPIPRHGKGSVEQRIQQEFLRFVGENFLKYSKLSLDEVEAALADAQRARDLKRVSDDAKRLGLAVTKRPRS